MDWGSAPQYLLLGLQGSDKSRVAPDKLQVRSMPRSICTMTVYSFECRLALPPKFLPQWLKIKQEII